MTKDVKQEDVKQEELLVPEETIDIKHVFESKTFWVNAIAVVAFFVQRKYGFVMDESIQAQLLGAINLWLRTVTKDPVRWTKSKR